MNFIVIITDKKAKKKQKLKKVAMKDVFSKSKYYIYFLNLC